jgi:hypothetical protein
MLQKGAQLLLLLLMLGERSSSCACHPLPLLLLRLVLQEPSGNHARAGARWEAQEHL